jgi:hypothetical protein
MRELSYVLRFERGVDAKPAAVATGLVTTTALAARGAPIKTTRRQIAGGVSYESVFVVEVDGVRFTESGIVNFGPDLHTLAFSTLGFGYLLAPKDPVTKMTPGAVGWTIDSGTGFFEGATGLITSNFRVNQATGQLIDDQVATILIPDGGTS